MKYYNEDAYGRKQEISKSKYYSIARRENAHVTIHTNNGRIVARSVRLK